MSKRRGEIVARPGWCMEHEDFGWLYTDGSSGCYYTCVVEMGSSECRIVPGVLTVRGKPKTLRAIAKETP